VIDTASGELLNDVVRRDSRSLLVYIGEAFPWTSPRGTAALLQLRTIVARHNAAVLALAKFLTRQHLLPGSHGSYPSSFTTLNFLALEHLLPRLIDAERRSLADLERDVNQITDATAKAEAAKLLAVKRQNLTELEAIKASPPESAAS
jgi:hypothetical protein